MAVIDQLKTASYRGIPFFYQSSTESGGFKVAEHLYPGSDNFKIEQLGQVPTRFNIECRIKFEDRDRFDNALNTQGSGILSHPMFGNFIVKVTEYTKSDTKNDLGLYDYSVQFVKEIGLIIPSIEGIALSVINSLRSTLVEKTSIYIKNALGVLGL